MSMDRTGEELGVSRQREDIEAMVRRAAGEVAETYIDNDVSASGRKPRPQFNALMDAVSRGDVECVAAWSLDRLTRNARDTLRLMEAGQQHNVTIMLVRDSDLDLASAGGRMTASILSSVAQHEIDRKSERQQAAERQAAKAGRRTSGRKPFGYEADGVTVREEEAAAIREACVEVLSGAPLSEIAERWNAAGLLSGQAKRATNAEGAKGDPARWTHQTVRHVLTNPRYAGIRTTPVDRPGTTRRRQREETGPAEWPALVDEDTFRAVEALLSFSGRSTGGPGMAGRYLLTGIARCGVCGWPVHGGGGETGRRNYRTYRCSATNGHISRKAAPIEEFISELLIARLSSPDASNLLATPDDANTAALRGRAGILRRRLNDLAAEMADDSSTLTVQQLRTATEGIKAKLADVEGRMVDRGRARTLAPLVDAPDVRAAWDELGVPTQRQVVETLVTVRVDPVGRGHWRFNPATVHTEWRG
jgi:DNA invertase Pin-like site-specific DNA recombinase